MHTPMLRPVSPSLWVLAAIFSLAAMAPAATAADALGVIEGVVTYQADAKRPWRYGRYYIKKASTGELAEAVVAIAAKGLGAGSKIQPKEVVVDQKNFQFIPETTAIRAGDRIKFTNSDQAAHNVRASGFTGEFNINMPAGGSHTVLFPKAGGMRQPLQVGCVFHSQMQAWVFVFDHSYYQLTAADGRFRLEYVPPGEYDLELSHPAGGLKWRKRVEVLPGAALRVDISLSPDDKSER